MRDFITTIFYGYFLSKEDSEMLAKKFESDKGESDGFFMFGEELDEKNDKIEALCIEEGINNSDELEYSFALAIRKSVKRMYANLKSEFHRISDLLKEPSERHRLVDQRGGAITR